MERVAWTDERLDDLSRRMDAGFARVDADIRDLREEHGRRFDGLDRRIDGLGSGLRGEVAGLRGEIEALRGTILRVGGGMMVGLVGVIAALLVRGS